MIKIVCSSCQKPLSLDETKLPMKEVAFPCPVCKTKLTVDRRNLETAGNAAAPAEAASHGADSTHDDDGHEDDDAFGARALIVGTDHPGLRQAAKLIGYLPTHYATAAEARDFLMQEFPKVVFISPAQLTPPPLEAMQPIISLMPADRRKSFFILVADGLRTLDGNAAFLYGVNLVVAAKDLGSFPQIYREANAYHERLYGPMNSVLKSLHSD
ncbi:MAG TPA: hypothetical protein VN605_09380 [Thermoanaerobaculia bacterium]|nr:hypothetical protein [Thermoanaerobaculia bacterium]